VAPLERLKILMQVQGNEKLYTGVVQVGAAVEATPATAHPQPCGCPQAAEPHLQLSQGSGCPPAIFESCSS
jgi:hypothetical protein